MRFIKCSAVLIAFFLVLGVSDAQQNPETNQKQSVQTQPAKQKKSEKYLKELDILKTEFSEKCEKIIEEGSSSKLYLVIFAYKQKTNKFEELDELINKYFEKYAKIRNAEIACIDVTRKNQKCCSSWAKHTKKLSTTRKKLKSSFCKQ